jgi:hypothetical protein
MYRTATFTPLFNSPNFFSSLTSNGGVDQTFHLRILETVAFPKSKIVKIKEEGAIVRLLFPEYSLSQELFTFASFIEEAEAEKKQKLPSKEQILKSLIDFPKIPYLLGGNTPFSIDLHCPLSFDPFANRHRKLFGIDCSGLLYFVTNGNVPRNTSQMNAMGEEVNDLLPLDAILFPGHVIIYLGDNYVIESRQFDGVTISKWQERQKQIPTYKIIRWYRQVFEEKLLRDDLSLFLNQG